MVFSEVANQTKQPFVLPTLPYGEDDLLPHLSRESFDYHYRKHHQAYVNTVNNLIANFGMLGRSLEEIIVSSFNDPEKTVLFNNAAQIWNHTFYWNSMKPYGGSLPQGKLRERIVSDFGSYIEFENRFKSAAVAQFGSGWVWLIWKGGRLEIAKTTGAENPIVHGGRPIFVCDVWEHAYYIDYRNQRADFVAAFLSHLVNWDFATENFNNAQKVF